MFHLFIESTNIYSTPTIGENILGARNTVLVKTEMLNSLAFDLSNSLEPTQHLPNSSLL